MAYSWGDPRAVLQLMGIKCDRNEIKITCPFCHGKNFGMNTVKGIGRCFSHGCEKTADIAAYYAATYDLSLQRARIEIEQRLGIIPDDQGVKRERVVFEAPVYHEAEQTDDETLDKTYRAFLAELHLSEKNKSMLRGRGFSDSQCAFLNYKTFPKRDEIDYRVICKRLLSDGYALRGVPGFFKDKGGNWNFIQLTKGIIMPQINHQNQITSLQIRKDDDLRVFVEERGELEEKCAWFSSKNREQGCTSGAKVHYACDFTLDKQTGEYIPVFEEGFVLTEGIMKADLIHYLQPNLPCIAVPGVHALKFLEAELIRLKEMGVKVILMCYDMDYLTNPSVQKALNDTKEMIEKLGFRYKQMTWETKITVDGETKELLKGLDDYLAYTKLNIIPQVVKKS